MLELSEPNFAPYTQSLESQKFGHMVSTWWFPGWGDSVPGRQYLGSTSVVTTGDVLVSRGQGPEKPRNILQDTGQPPHDEHPPSVHGGKAESP